MRSRINASLRSARSQSTMANMPTAACRVCSMPQPAKQASTVSVSEWPRQAGASPSCCRRSRSSMWL
ncbi:Uncharacterised protein [Bordetella pertussis]|nr:Uncharacterised protein [Bordetella pertussis]CFN82186.1 Uncharacterised protein [Bordetella pertussis]CFO05612.1 Uncharacterised protein [Bordetella pertussis]CFO37170.1 Uncharacterised protein [Bordetella pertussis]CFP12669.1 Uncharacterised protein [Bordetella pertussis]